MIRNELSVISVLPLRGKEVYFFCGMDGRGDAIRITVDITKARQFVDFGESERTKVFLRLAEMGYEPSLHKLKVAK